MLVYNLTTTQVITFNAFSQYVYLFLPLFLFQIVTDQQTGQKIQIVTTVDPTCNPKQQFILASPDSQNAKQLIFTTADSLVPGRIQVQYLDIHAVTEEPLLNISHYGKICPTPAIWERCFGHGYHSHCQ